MALTVTAASVVPSSAALRNVGTAGASITAGQPVYIDTANGNVIKPANADAGATAPAYAAAGIAEHAAATGQRISYVYQDPSFTHGITASEIAPGQVVLLDDTAGGMTVTYTDIDAADYSTVIGQINNPETTMNLRPMTAVLKAAS